MGEPRVKGSIANGNKEDRDPNDFYATPPGFTRLMLSMVHFDGPVLEPAAGDGAISTVLQEHGLETVSADVAPRTETILEQDFITYPYEGGKYDIVTNPPFKLWAEFFEKAMIIARRRIAFVAPISIMNSGGRYERIWKVWKPAHIILAPRYQVIRTAKGMVPSQFTHVWIVWDRENAGYTRFSWGPNVIYRGDEK